MAAKLGDDNVPNCMGGGAHFPGRHGRGLTLHTRNSFSSPASNAGLIFYEITLTALLFSSCHICIQT
jgi:hypothetical protein